MPYSSVFDVKMNAAFNSRFQGRNDDPGLHPVCQNGDKTRPQLKPGKNFDSAHSLTDKSFNNSNPSLFNAYMNKNLLSLIAVVSLSASAFADIVYVTSRPNPSGSGPQNNGTYFEVNLPTLGDFGAAGTAPGRPATSGAARTYISSAFMTDTTAGVNVYPTLAVPGGIYQIDYNFNSVAGNTSTNIVMAVSSTNATLSFATTDKFQRSFGNPANQWRLMGYLTNDAGSSTPWLEFRYQSGAVSGAGTPSSAANRLLFDTWRFTLVEPCLSVPVVSVTGPLSTNSTDVVVTGVSATATNVFVYQNSGSGMVLIGSKLSGVTAGNNTVTVSGLVKTAIVAATQKIDGQEGCLPTTGTIVGGGANPRIRVALSIRETTDTGPIGATAVDFSSTSIHFLGSTNLLGSAGGLNGAPSGGIVFNPSAGWQTVSFLRGTNEIVGDSANTSGQLVSGAGYAASETVSVQVFAFRDLPNGVRIFSVTPAQSTDVTSNDFFQVTWTWDSVTGANGYRVLRSYNFAGYNEYLDVSGTSLTDTNAGWLAGNTVTPNTSQPGASIRWNPSISLTNALPGTWGILESINFVIDDLSDTGPFDIYIDNLKNAGTTWQTFENSVAGAQDVSFRAPSFSGTTAGNLLSSPNSSVISIRAADTGTKSLRVRYQWGGTNSTRWLRLTTSGVGNPLVNLDEEISFRMLLLPANQLPVQPPAPTLTINRYNTDTVLEWTGAHNLQASTLVTGTYTNVSGVTTAPWTNTFGESEKFFRLADPYDN